MSEKYSTEGLIDALNRKTRGYGFADIQENEIDAIIARLRAADRLCEDVKHEIEVIDDERIGRPFIKAIAEYEEGK